MKSLLPYAAASAFLLLSAATAASEAPPTPEPAPATKGPVDGLRSSPANFKLLLENEHVRVLQYTLPPGALDHWHTHPPRVGYVISGAKIRVTEADGSHKDYDEKTGETYWGEFSPLHDTLNIDTKPYIALLVEVKGAGATSASARSAAIETALARAAKAWSPTK